MRIYTMTATFGKLENQTLSFREGLNVIHAPNEWGKSTWCAFLVAMLYGIDTSQRSKQGYLADKERYAPWSGSPMSGRIDLCWNGRDITIERQTKSRVAFGEFRAYETVTGVAVPELTGANCGQLLLGVEKSVFTRAGFIKLSELPISDDDALRRRLNALVTTGDESGKSDTLSQKLKELKNHCRHNKTGMLPQLEAQRTALEGKLQQLRQLQTQDDRLVARLEEVEEQLRLLNNHLAALASAAAQADARRVAAAQEALEAAEQACSRLEAQCEGLPDKRTAEESILQLEQLRMDWDALRTEVLPPLPEMPEAPAPFAGMTPGEALEQARTDVKSHKELSRRMFPIFLLLAAIALSTFVFTGFRDWKISVPILVLTATLVYAHFRNAYQQKKYLRELTGRYDPLPVGMWTIMAESYAEEMAEYTEAEAAYRTHAENLAARQAAMEENIAFTTGGCSVEECVTGWRETLALQEALAVARYNYDQARNHAEAVTAMAKTAQAPAFADTMTCSEAQTRQLLTEAAAQQRQLQLQQGHIRGQMEALGQETALEQQLSQIRAKIDRLEEIYAATVLAMETLAEASAGLQRKFAPRISRRAQSIFAQLTDSRYDRLLLDEDLDVRTGAKDEVTLRTRLWRSDGTADQQYLALRLAVAGELTPHAPLVLDDALVRFDDTRLARAMEILKQEAMSRQVIVFTCQGREQKYL